MKCKCEDDRGAVCNKTMSREEHEQDGMCSDCANKLWENFVQPLWSGKPPKEFIHEKHS